MRGRVVIIGSGLAGLSAALTLADAGVASALVSPQHSERAQSVMAEGGINAALDLMGEQDTPEEHFRETMAGGVDLADPNAVRSMTEEAPQIVCDLVALGVPFNTEHGKMIQRNFGGQKKKRTAYAKSSTGKVLVTALIDAVRRHEASGLVERLPRHELLCLDIRNESLRGPDPSGAAASISSNTERHAEDAGPKGPFNPDNATSESAPNPVRGSLCCGAWVRDVYAGEVRYLEGPVILASGGIGGMLGARNTGTTVNQGDVAAIAFAQGVELANLEFLQYHPTTVPITGKRMLISEAARGEGGRLFTLRDGVPWYFMEDKYPELGNLMPRDVVSREEVRVMADPRCCGTVWLDMRGLDKGIWKNRLSDLREEIIHYQKIDPATEPVPVEPGMHYCMGGICVDEGHRTNVAGLYAAGECAAQYHGANRLGGNSLLGAIYGGRVAARTAKAELGEGIVSETRRSFACAQDDKSAAPSRHPERSGGSGEAPFSHPERSEGSHAALEEASSLRGYDVGVPSDYRYAGQTDVVLSDNAAELEMERVLESSLGILRSREGLEAGIEALESIDGESASARMVMRLNLARAMLQSALAREESRGAHTRTDFPERDDERFHKTTVARLDNGEVVIDFRNIPSLHAK